MKNFKFAMKKSTPLLASYIFLGIAFGMMFAKEGYPPLASFLSGVFIYAGSMQIAMIPLIVNKTPLYVIALMTLFINGRHMFYGISFIEKFRKMEIRYPYMVITTTDETYSVMVNMDYPKDLDETEVDFFIHLICHGIWAFSCLLGSVIGEIVPSALSGIEFSAVAFFVTVVVEQLRTANTKIPFFIGLSSAIVFLILIGPSNFIVPAISTSLVALLVVRTKINWRSVKWMIDCI